jgi:Bacterial Ig-like domain (group 3)/MBG domain (YGX type)
MKISQAPLTITAASPSINYGAAVPAITPIYAGLQYADTGPATHPKCSATAYLGSAAGSYSTSCSSAYDISYAITYVKGTLTIGSIASATTLLSSSSTTTYGQKVILTARVTSTYGTVTGSVTFFYGWTGLGTAAVSSGQAALVTSAIPAGSQSLIAVFNPTFNLSGNANYTASMSATVPETVSPAPLTITAGSPTLAYGAVPAISPAYSGLLNSAAAPSTPPTCGLDTAPASAVPPVGFYPTSCSGASDSNYSITYVGGNLTIVPAPLTISASSPVIAYGGAVPAITHIYSGLQNGDAAPATPPACATTAVDVAEAGRYATACSGADDANYSISYVNGILTVGPAGTTTTLASDTGGNAITYGDTVTLTATVSADYGTPAGAVSFYDGSTPLGSASLSGGQATLTTTGIAAGNRSLTAVFASSANGNGAKDYGASTSPAVIQPVNPASLFLFASSPTVNYGSAISSIVPSYAGLRNGNRAPATLPICGPGASTGSDAGTYPTVCTGALDPNYLITYVNGIVTINPIASTTVVSSSSTGNTSTYGSSVTLTAKVSATYGKPAGTVIFWDGSTQLGTAAVSSGQGTFSTTTLPAGANSISATFTPGYNSIGELNYNPSTSAAITQTVKRASLTITAVSPTVSYGSSIPTIAASYKTLPTGFTSTNPAPVCSTTATLGSDVGKYPTVCSDSDPNFTITYAGGYLTIAAAAPKTVLSSSSPSNTSIYGQSVTLTATEVAPYGTPTGTVTFKDGNTSIGTASLSGGQASFTTIKLAVGKHYVKAVYTPSAGSNGLFDFATSTSAVLTQTITST